MKDEVLSDPCDSDARAPYASYSGAQLSPRCPDSFITCQVIIRERERAESKASLSFTGSAAAVRLDAFPMRRGRSVTALFQWEATEALGVLGLFYHPFLIFTLSGF